MKSLPLNLRGAKKVAGDKHSSTFHMENGHKLIVAHAALPALQRKQLEKMPVHLDEGTPDAPVGDSDISDQGSEWAPPPGSQQAAPASPPPSPASQEPASQPPVNIPPPSAPPQSGGVDFQGAYNQGQKGISEAAQAAQQNAQANSDTMQKDVVSRQELNDNFQKNLGDIQTHQKQLMQDYAAGRIDPKHYVESMGSGQKVSTAIGLLLGGLASRNGGPNPAMDYLNKQVDRDIAAQNQRMDQQKTLLGANQDLYKDAILGQQATRINQNDMLDHQIQLQAAKSGSLQAKATADQAHSSFAMQNGQLLNSMAVRKTIMDQLQGAAPAAAGGTGRLLPMDPSSVVPYMVQNPDQQKQVYEEIGRAQNVAKNQQQILKYFDDSTKENTVARTGAGYLRTPGSVMALHQLLLPNFKQIDGTVRQAAMDETFHNVTPAPGDDQHKIDQKRDALVNWMHSETAAPVAKGNGIDLSRFTSTAAPAIKGAAPPSTVVQNGVTYNLNPKTGKYE